MSLVFAKPAFAEGTTFTLNSSNKIADNKNNDKKKPVKPLPPAVIVLGDSLTSGHGIEDNKNNYHNYAEYLEIILRKFGYPIDVLNSSVAGSTSAHAYARLLKLLKEKRKYILAIVAVGYNDSLAKIPARNTSIYLEKIMEKLDNNEIPVVLMGIKAPAKSPRGYTQEFNAIYPRLSSQFNSPFYPFLLEGIFMRSIYTLGDMAHPNKKGLQLMVQNTAPIIMYALFEALNGRRPVKYPKKKKKQ